MINKNEKDADFTELAPTTSEQIEEGTFKTAANKSSVILRLYVPLGVSENTHQLDIRRPIFNDDILAEKASESDDLSLMIAKTALLTGLPQHVIEDIDLIEDIHLLKEAYDSLKVHPEYDTADNNEQLTLAENRRSVHIKLEFPVEYKDKVYDELTMQRPRLRHSRDSEKSSQFQSEKNAYQYADLCSVPIGVIKLIDAIDDAKSLDQAYAMFRRSKTNRSKKY